MRAHRSLRVPAALALSFALAPPAFAGPTVKKRAWSTTVLKVEVSAFAPWAAGYGSTVLPVFTCPAGETYRLMSMQVVPAWASLDDDVALAALSQLGPWQAVLAFGVPPAPARENAVVAVAGVGAQGAEIRVEAGVELLPTSGGGQNQIAISTTRRGVRSAEFTVFLSGACGTPGEVVESPWRPM